MHKGDVGVLGVQVVGESNGVIIGSQTAPRLEARTPPPPPTAPRLEAWTPPPPPPASKNHCRVTQHQGIGIVVGHANVGDDLERPSGVPDIGECLAIGSDDGLIDHGIVLFG